MEDLPLDIVFNILSRISVKSLLPLRSVSKPWRHIIDHPLFADMHVSQGNEEPNMLLLIPSPTPSLTKLSFRLVEERGRTPKAIESSIAEFDLINQCHLMGSCNGLLCFEYNNNESYILLNPFRKGHVALPEATIKSYPSKVSCGLGFHSSTNTYKVVRVVTCLRHSPFVSRVEVHKVGTSSWREITEVPPYLLQGKPVFAHGVLHWFVTAFLISRTHGEPLVEHLEGVIVSFDVGKEKFNVTPHPSSHRKNRSLFKLLDVKGNLAIADLSSQSRIYIWVMKSYETKEWAREYKIKIHKPRRYQVHNGHIEVIGVWENGEIVLKSNEDIFIYNQETGLRHSQGLVLESGLGVLFSHRGSLISMSQVTAAC